MLYFWYFLVPEWLRGAYGSVPTVALGPQGLLLLGSLCLHLTSAMGSSLL